ncbi:MAG: glycosyltransferase family 4 protein [Candidatus Bathyarchaeia archaeon]
MTETRDNQITGEELIQRVRQTFAIQDAPRPRFLYEYVNDILSQIVKDVQPYSKLPVVKHLPPKIHELAIRLLAHQIVSTNPQPRVHTFSTTTHLRARRLKGRILGVLPYPISDPKHGGQFRAHDIYSNLSKDFEIIALSMGIGALETQITPNLRDICIPIPEKVAKAQRALAMHIGNVATRVALVGNYSRSEPFMRKFDELSDAADIVIFSHPYFFQLENRLSKEKIVAYDCVDVEYDLFKSLLKGQSETKYAARVMKIADDIERNACQRSDLIFVTCAEQGVRLRKLYQINSNKIHIVPNPIETLQSPNKTGDETREKRKAELGLGNNPIVLYLASWHPPHLKSLGFILSKLVTKHPEWTFLILGTIADELSKPYMKKRLPKNVIAYANPTPREKSEIFKAVDIAINPSTYGSGTEIKILVYMMAGLPIVTTQTGVRGLNVRDRYHVIISDPDNLGANIQRLLKNDHLRNKIIANSRRFVKKYDAHEIANDVSSILLSTLELSTKENPEVKLHDCN